MARTFALDDEAAMIVCNYERGTRPVTPFPYFSEAFTGMEYSTGSHMMYAGLVKEGVQCFESARARFDGEKRNPWDEAECGHHYARAMSAWSGVLALSGFRYRAPDQAVVIAPRIDESVFQCFWSCASGWGTFTLRKSERGGADLALRVLHGKLTARSCELKSSGAHTTSQANGAEVAHETSRQGGLAILRFSQPVSLLENGELRIAVRA